MEWDLPVVRPLMHTALRVSYRFCAAFLCRLAEFTGKHDQWLGIIATDSQSLIDTVQQKQAPAASLNGATVPSDTDMATIPSFPLEPTLPEWDVLRGSQALLHDMPQLALQHVKGHQDRDFPYRHLSLLAQLNVDADAQATNANSDSFDQMC